MRFLKISLLFFLNLSMALAAGPQASKSVLKPVQLVHFPRVLSYSGRVWIQSGLETQFRTARVKEILREKAVIKTEANSRLDLAIDKGRTVTIQESSQIEIPLIAWESGQMMDLILVGGEVFWQQNGAAENTITLRCPVFEIQPPVGISGFSYDGEKVLAEAKMFSGSMEFKASNAENSVILTAGKSVKFKGVKEDGNVAYDVLLKGRRIPKGHLQNIENLPESVMAIYLPSAIEARKKADLAKIFTEKSKKKTHRRGEICGAPGGKLNECSWSCLKNPGGEKKNCLADRSGVSCVRRRCNANGSWGEETALESGAASAKCKAQVFVAPCDY